MRIMTEITKQDFRLVIADIKVSPHEGAKVENIGGSYSQQSKYGVDLQNIINAGYRFDLWTQ